ncbi:hypothetical protein BGX38DRAFT_1176794 [Terfezia claveryi]|nr:hypothetical protein BGX38DRAFT_1176794 [Terfezia claveryi]
MSTPRVRSRTFFRSERPRFRVRLTGSTSFPVGEAPLLALTVLLLRAEEAGAPPSSLPSASTQPDPPRASPPLDSPISQVPFGCGFSRLSPWSRLAIICGSMLVPVPSSDGEVLPEPDRMLGELMHVGTWQSGGGGVAKLEKRACGLTRN